MKKQLSLILLLVIFNHAIGQDQKNVTLTVDGSGTSQDDARKNALRNAVEQAFGAFISSNTEVLNDKLIRDEIVSVTNGNIQNYSIIAETVLPNGEFNSVLSVTVSLNKLDAFCENKGIASDFKGSLFAYNVKLQKLNEESEIKAIKNITSTAYKMSLTCFDYSINVYEPVARQPSQEWLKGTGQPTREWKEGDSWLIELTVNVKSNSNWATMTEYLANSLKGIFMSIEEQESYLQTKRYTYPISVGYLKKNNKGKSVSYSITGALRTLTAYQYLNVFAWTLSDGLTNFMIDNGLYQTPGWGKKYVIHESRQYPEARWTYFTVNGLGKYDANGTPYTSNFNILVVSGDGKDASSIRKSYPFLKFGKTFREYTNDDINAILGYCGGSADKFRSEQNRMPNYPGRYYDWVTDEYKDLYGGILFSLNLNEAPSKNIEINFQNYFSTEDLSKISQFKVMPAGK